MRSRHAMDLGLNIDLSLIRVPAHGATDGVLTVRTL